MTQHLSSWQLTILAIAVAAIVANSYYIHPIVAHVAADFGVGPALIGLVPAVNQISLAVGIFLLLPLGDRMDNARLAGITLLGQCIALTAMATVQRFELFVVASSFMGFTMVVPYLMPAWVSKRVEPGQIGHVTAILTTGVLAGILLSRTGAGVIGEFLDWRWVYALAAALMGLLLISLPRAMAGDEEAANTVVLPYPALLASVFSLVRHSPDVAVSGIIQGFGFAMFLSVWLGLGLHLTSTEMGYGVDTVGYLALLAAFSLLTTPRLGRLADQIGPLKARAIFAVLQLIGVVSLSFTGHSLWLLIPPILLMNIFGPLVDVAGRMIILAKPGNTRTRLMTGYICLMFIGGGIGSWAGPAAYGLGGWSATALTAIGFSGISTLLSIGTWLRASHER